MQKKARPFIPSHRALPEITIKGTLLAIILTIILAASNVYLSLRVGMTVSASIPAAVISMGVLRFFKHSNVLENNIVQTSASMGEAMVSGLAFILPALIILHYWSGFYYWPCVAIALIGGFFGILFGIPIRRVLLNDETLRFPEGTAVAAVLKASLSTVDDMRYLVGGGVLGGLITFFQAGLGILSDSFSYWFVRSNVVYGFGWGYTPALIAAGYIIGIYAAISVLTGVIIGWVLGMPILSIVFHLPLVTGDDLAHALWAQHIRYIGVGTMLVAALWVVVSLMKQMYIGIRKSLQSLKIRGGLSSVPRTERDIPIHVVLWSLLIVTVLAGIFIFYIMPDRRLGLHLPMMLGVSVLGALSILVIGFILCSVAGYFAGLVGATNNPGSSLTVAGLLIFCLLLLIFFHLAGMSHMSTFAQAGLAIIVVSAIGAGLSITCDTLQDLKTGQIVGATPWKQQVMLILGCIVAAFILPPILNLLLNAYGIAGVFPRPGMDPAQMLAAPQANLMAAVATGVFTHQVNYPMLVTGAVIALFSILIGEVLQRTTRLRFSVLGVGIGIYLPISVSMSLVFGGLLSFFVNHIALKRKNKRKLSRDESVKRQHNGLLLACGLVAGASLMGVLLAIPFALLESSTVLQIIVPEQHMLLTNVLAIAATLGLFYLFYRVVCGRHVRK